MPKPAEPRKAARKAREADLPGLAIAALTRYAELGLVRPGDTLVHKIARRLTARNKGA